MILTNETDSPAVSATTFINRTNTKIIVNLIPNDFLIR
ncbi:hypothetical protein ES703_94212 [subsurface metagenome]